MSQCEVELETLQKQHVALMEFEQRKMVRNTVENVLDDVLSQSSDSFDKEAMASVILKKVAQMEELVAKRYIKAVKSSSDIEVMKSMTTIFTALAESFKNDNFIQIINNPNIAKNQKSEILLDAVKSAESNQVNNLIKLLVENNRINIIPAIANEMKKDLASSTKTYSGVVYSDSDIDAKVIQDLSDGLGKKFDSSISLDFVKNDFNGIKVDVEDLGIEINFSKTRINSQIIEHIVKAI